MTNQSPDLIALQNLEAEIELSNRIALHQRLNRLLADPNSTIDEIKELVTLLSQMLGDYSRRIKALNRERELALGELRLEVRQEAMALQREKMELDPVPTSRRSGTTDSAPRGKQDDEQPTEAAEPRPANKTNLGHSQELAVLPKYTSPGSVSTPGAIAKFSSEQNGHGGMKR